MEHRPYRVSLITELDEAVFEERVTSDLNFAVLNWNAQLISIKFNTTGFPELESVEYAALVVYRLPAEGEAQS